MEFFINSRQGIRLTSIWLLGGWRAFPALGYPHVVVKGLLFTFFREERGFEKTTIHGGKLWGGEGKKPGLGTYCLGSQPGEGVF